LARKPMRPAFTPGFGSAALCAVGGSLSTDRNDVVLTPECHLYRMPDG
jgi:hypothetical protein